MTNCQIDVKSRRINVKSMSNFWVALMGSPRGSPTQIFLQKFQNQLLDTKSVLKARKTAEEQLSENRPKIHAHRTKLTVQLILPVGKKPPAYSREEFGLVGDPFLPPRSSSSSPFFLALPISQRHPGSYFKIRASFLRIPMNS